MGLVEMAELRWVELVLPHTTLEKVSDAVAVGAITTPLWLRTLQETSQIAGLLLPIAGVIFLIVRIVSHIYLTRKRLNS